MLFAHKKKAPDGRFELRKITDENGISAAFKLAETVFMQFEAPEYSEQGVESFLSFLWGSSVKEMLENGSYVVWGCYSGAELVGMMAMRDSEHISLAFVMGDFHRQGIGRMLYAEAKRHALSHGKRSITVNASPYGVPFYRAVGFKETDMELIADGIRYTPMKAKI